MPVHTLHTLLDGFQKPELQDLGNILGSSLSPRLRKSQLVEQLHTYLHTEPRQWMSHLMERDVRLLRELVHAGPEKVQYQDYADYPSLLEVTGLLPYDDSDENYHKVWITRELYDIVAPEVDKVFRALEKNGQFEVERMGLGYLNLYGILPTEHFVDLMMDWYKEAHDGDFVRLTRILHSSPLVKMYRYTDKWGDYLCSPCIYDVDEIFSLRESFGKQSYRDSAPGFTPQEACEAGAGAPYFTIGLHSLPGMRLEQMYRRLGWEGLDLVKAVHDTWMEAQYTSGSNDALFQPLLDSPLCQDLDSKAWENCCQIVCEYADSIPKWCLFGLSAAQTGLCKAVHQSWETPEIYPQGFAIPHVAPDEPCPCGSGLRYCRCHGKYLS